MQPNADDLTALERRLADCRPAAVGLDADAMLFAAGQAAALKARTNWAWPAATFAFAITAAFLGTALVGERSERLALAERLVRHSVTPETPAPTAVASTESPPAADSYFAARRMIDSDSDLFPKPDTGSVPTPAPVAEPPTLRAWMPDDQR